MSIPSGLTRFVLTWSMPGNEIAQSAWWEAGHVIADVDDSALTTMGASGSFTTWLGTIKPLWSANTLLSALDGYFYNGGTAAAAHGRATLNTVGTGASVHPNQICAVMTLKTALAGRRTRGRMYLPANGAGMGTAGIFTQSGIDNARIGTAAYFSTRNDITGGVVVVSQTASSSQLVTSVAADYIPDTQRRRNNKLQSLRLSSAVT